MKKSSIIKLVSIVLIFMMVSLVTVSVFAADDASFNEITLSGNNTSSSNTNSNTTNSNTNTNTNSNTNSNINISKNNTNVNNSSVYNTNNLPQTGISDSIPVVMLVVVFGISAVFAYKKISDYKNI